MKSIGRILTAAAMIGQAHAAAAQSDDSEPVVIPGNQVVYGEYYFDGCMQDHHELLAYGEFIFVFDQPLPAGVRQKINGLIDDILFQQGESDFDRIARKNSVAIVAPQFNSATKPGADFFDQPVGIETREMAMEAIDEIINAIEKVLPEGINFVRAQLSNESMGYETVPNPDCSKGPKYSGAPALKLQT